MASGQAGPGTAGEMSQGLDNIQGCGVLDAQKLQWLGSVGMTTKAELMSTAPKQLDGSFQPPGTLSSHALILRRNNFSQWPVVEH